MSYFRNGITLEDEIDFYWSCVDKLGPNECWNWKRAVRSVGIYGHKYGVFTTLFPARKLIGAHRYSYILKNGTIVDKLLVCHSCDNTLCVNPNHLFLGTHKINAEDRNNKNRHCHGEDSHLHKLTKKQVKSIRKKFKPKVYTRKKLAIEFNVTESCIKMILAKRTWKNLI